MTIRQLKVSEVASVVKQLSEKQGHKCDVCGHPFTKRDYPVLDHCHTTGFIRGAIHNSCNGAEGRCRIKANLGHTGISADKYLIGLGKYLERNQKPRYPLIHPSHKTDEQKRLDRNAKARRRRAAAKKAK